MGQTRDLYHLTQKRKPTRREPKTREAFNFAQRDLIFFENLRNQHLHKFHLGVWNETEFTVFWLRRKHSFLFFVSTPHQNSLQCLSLSRKRNQEPVDISHFFFWPFHISMFRRFSIFHRQIRQI